MVDCDNTCLFLNLSITKYGIPEGDMSSRVGFLNFSNIVTPSLAEILRLVFLCPPGLSMSKLEVTTVVLNGALVFELV